MTSHAISTTENVASTATRQKLDLGWSDFKWPLMFMLSMSMMGLTFPLGYLFVPLILINRFRNDRYDFVIMLMIFLGGYGLLAPDSLGIKLEDISFFISVALLIFYRKRGIVRKTFFLLIAYCSTIFILSLFSDETLVIQIRLMRYYFLFSCFIIPIACFSNHEFDIMVFFRKLMPFILLLCIFYAVDGFILCGHILMPRTPTWEPYLSYFYSPIIYWFPHFVRKYPHGLILLALAIYPIAKFYKLPLWQWVVILAACASTQTFTVISGFIVGAVVCVSNGKRVILYIVGALGFLTALYFIDGMLPTKVKDGYDESFFRVKSSIDQFFDLAEAVDDEDVSEFASGRMAQAMPKMELVSNYNKELTGLGFLHPQLTTNTKYIIDNEYYIGVDYTLEVATGIETEVLQVYVTIGILGLLAYLIFFSATYLIIRKYKYSRYYLSVLVMVFWFGMGAYGGLTVGSGLVMVSFTFAIVVMQQKSIEREIQRQKEIEKGVQETPILSSY